MKYTWKAAALALTAAILTGCGSTTAAETETTTAADTTATTETTTAAETTTASTTTTEAAADGSNILVVYYSATGNTAAVAQEIADAVGADLFEITPEEPYTDDDLNWSDENSRVTQEHDDESLRDVPLTTTAVEGWENYDTVFIGYPIWWGIAAWPTDSFVKANDFTGKTVIPFCTSSSSGIGESGELLAEEAGTGTWLEGQRFSSHPDADEVAEFAQSVISE